MKFNFKIYLALGILILLKCGLTEEPKKYGYFNSDQKLKIISLNDIKTLNNEELYHEIVSAKCKGENVVLRFKSNSKLKLLALSNECKVRADYKINNVFFIIDNKIIKNYNEFEINKLEEQLTFDYLNHGKIKGYSNGPSMLLIHLQFSSKNKKQLINILDRITSVYDSLNIKDIMFVNFIHPENNEYKS